MGPPTQALQPKYVLLKAKLEKAIPEDRTVEPEPIKAAVKSATKETKAKPQLPAFAQTEFPGKGLRLPERPAPAPPEMGVRFEFGMDPFEYDATTARKESDRKATLAWAAKSWAVKNGRLVEVAWKDQPERTPTGLAARVIRMGKETLVNTVMERIDGVDREIVPGCIEVRNGVTIEILTAIIDNGMLAVTTCWDSAF